MGNGTMRVTYNDYTAGIPVRWDWSYAGELDELFSATLTAEGNVDKIESNQFLLDLTWDLTTNPGSPLISALSKSGPKYGETWGITYTNHQLNSLAITRSNGDVIAETYQTAESGLPGRLTRNLNGTTLLDVPLIDDDAAADKRVSMQGPATLLYDTRGNLGLLSNP